MSNFGNCRRCDCISRMPYQHMGAEPRVHVLHLRISHRLAVQNKNNVGYILSIFPEAPVDGLEINLAQLSIVFSDAHSQCRIKVGAIDSAALGLFKK